MIELMTRTHLLMKYEKNWFYPVFDVDCLDERWKQTLTGVEN